MDPKSGWKTTEFWTTIILLISGVILLIIGVVTGNETAMTWGGSLLGVSGAAYTASRTLVKRKTTPPPTPSE